MAYFLNYRIVCDTCKQTEARTVSKSVIQANSNFTNQGWVVMGTSLEGSKHTCPNCKGNKHEIK
ncbi:MAG: hypothetical protein Tp152SUR00d2C52646391_52 [Prokaryotic dsDNA virus sp.]|nr:MAG: hypothetical protein Tp152SUR00d2C52646391_52 [Prokaryotic dsDNA virus sp.]